MKQLNFNLIGQISFKVGDSKYEIVSGDNSSDATFIVKGQKLNKEFSTLNEALRFSREINSDFNLSVKKKYKINKSHNISGMEINDILYFDVLDVQRVKPLINYYQNTYRRNFAFHFEMQDNIRKFKVTRIK